MFDINTTNAADFDFKASDGTELTFSKITSKGNIQVQFPEGHELADGQGAGRIFRPDGSHYKDQLSVTVSATPKAPTPTPVTAPTPVAAAAPNPLMALSDAQLEDAAILIRGKLYRLELVDDFNHIVAIG